MLSVLALAADPDLCEALQLYLPGAGCETLLARSGGSALAILEEKAPDLLLVDLSIAEEEIWVRLRSSAGPSVPAVVIAGGEELERVAGFDPRADDFVRKPASMRELIVRVRRLLRSGRAERREQLGPIRIDRELRRVLLPSGAVELTLLELKLLARFISSAGQIQTRQSLLKEVWNAEDASGSRTVDTHVRRLREKMGEWRGLIRTVHGVGYIMLDRTV